MVRPLPSISTTPDGNMIEVYWPTGLPVRQPHVDPIDLAQDEEILLAQLNKFSRRPA
jgi:hypothetical protein